MGDDATVSIWNVKMVVSGYSTEILNACSNSIIVGQLFCLEHWD